MSEVTLMLDYAQFYVKQGLSLHWLPPKEKAIYSDGWQTRPSVDWDTLKGTYTEGANLGVRPGKFSSPYEGFSLVIVDFDVNDAACSVADVAEAKAAVWALFGCDPSFYPSVISGSNGHSRHYWAVVPTEKLPPSQLAAAATRKARKPGRKTDTPIWAIEFMSNRRQVVVPPSVHPVTGGYYRWEKDLTGGIPQLSEAAIARLSDLSASDVDPDRTPDMPTLIPEDELPPISALFAPNQVKQYLAGEIGPYTPEGTHWPGALNSVAAHLFIGGHTPAQVLSLLYYHCHDVAVRHANNGRAAVWLWKYTVSGAAAKFERRFDPPPPTPVLVPEPEAAAGTPGGSQLQPVLATDVEDLVQRALRLNLDDADEAVRLYLHAERHFSSTKADQVLDALVNRGFKSSSLRRDARKMSKVPRREVTPESGPGQIIYGDHRDPMHPIHRKLSTRIEPSPEYLVGRFIYVPNESNGNGRWHDRLTQKYFSAKSMDDICQVAVNRMIEVGAVPEKSTASRLLLAREDTLYAFGETYWPGAMSCVVDTQMAGGKIVPLINTWRPENIPVGPSDCAPWLDHLTRLVPDHVERGHVLDLLACTLQRPGEKINHALVFVSSMEGAGKDTLLKPLHLALGENIADVNYRMVMSDYQSWQKSRKVIVIQELGSDSKVDLTQFDNYMKDKIASTGSGVSMMNLKFGNQDHVQPNLTFFIILSNHAIPIMPGESTRRYFPVKVPESYTPDPETLTSLHSWIEAGGWMNVIRYLKARDISRFQPTAPPPKTSFLMELTGMSSNGASDAVVDAVANLRRRGRAWFTAKDLHLQMVRDDRVNPKAIDTVDKVDKLAMQANFPMLKDPKGRPYHVPVPEAFWDPVFADQYKADFREMRRRRVFAAQRKRPAQGVTEFQILESLCPEKLRPAFTQWYDEGKYHELLED